MSAAPLYPEPRVLPAGDQALLLELGEGIDEQVNRRVHALDQALRHRAVPGVLDLVPTYRSLLVEYDPARIQPADLERIVLATARSLAQAALPSPRTVAIPTCYGGALGPDLALVAAHNHLTEQQVISLHTASVCRVFMMGFSPGFAYLGGMSPRIATPRRQTPRTSIPAGSVGIAQQQTGIYPVESPGGWQLVGRTPLRLFDPGAAPPTLLEPGDLVRFVAIDEARYRELANAEERGGQAEGGRRNEEPVVEVLAAGLLTTVQDAGRYGYQRYGVPVSGAMDGFALRVANLLVGNEENAAALEMTVAGAEIRFVRGAVIAVAGGDLQPRLDDRTAPMWEAFPVSPGAILSFRGLRAGARAYVAIAGGFDVPLVLGSRSTYLRSRLGGFLGRPLEPGDRLARLAEPPVVETRRMPSSWLPTYLGSHRLRVVLGPQDAAFTLAGVRTLLSSAYVVGAQSDRMGYRLEGPRIEHRGAADIVSDGTPPGAVQVAGDGLPLVLLADRGTTGGYAKIAAVIGADLPRLAQARPGDRVFFDAVSVAEAHDAWRRQDAVLAAIRNGPRSEVVAGQAPRHRPPPPPLPGGQQVETIAALLPGRIAEVLVRTGDVVARGQRLCVLEAMKMQNPVCAARAGRVTAVRVSPGDQVSHGQALVEIRSDEKDA